jgi:trimeric autotransporter adhesin
MKNLKWISLPLENSVDNVLKLQGVQYDWKGKKKFSDKHQIGLIAQDVEKVFPEVVMTDSKTGMKSVMYDHLVSPIIETVKAMWVKITQHDTAIETLQAENAKLKEDNVAIKAWACSQTPRPAFCK